MYNISNYKMVESILRSICKYHNVEFVDIEVRFDKEDKTGFIDGKLFIGNPNNLSLAMYRMISLYVMNFDNFYSKNVFCNDIYRFNLLNAVFNYLRKISSFQEEEETVVQRLYQQTLAWIVMKDILCPAFDIEVKNCLVLLKPTAWVDVSCYAENEKEDFVILNTDISNEVIKQAALLCEVIKLHGLNAKDVVSYIDGTDIIDKINGVATLAFANDNDASDFIIMLKVFSGLALEEEWKILSTTLKTAQMNGPGASWWFLGIIEKLLDPVRGSDWSTYKEMAPYYKEVQDKIDKARKAAGRAGLTYEALLRTISGEVQPEDVKLIEENLSSDRIW